MKGAGEENWSGKRRPAWGRDILAAGAELGPHLARGAASTPSCPVPIREARTGSGFTVIACIKVGPRRGQGGDCRAV